MRYREKNHWKILIKLGNKMCHFVVIIAPRIIFGIIRELKMTILPNKVNFLINQILIQFFVSIIFCS